MIVNPPHLIEEYDLDELYTYKNKQDKIIIVYHFDEKKGIEYVNELFEKGFDNVFQLSGGVEGFGQEIEGGLEGPNIPMFAKKEEVRKFKKTRL